MNDSTRNGPAPDFVGVEVNVAPAAATAVGDAIMPTSRVKSTGKPAHGWFSVNVSVNGSVTVIDFTLLASTARDDDREVGAEWRSMLNFTAAAS